MKAQKQLFRHNPAAGVFGDCHRTAIACMLDLDAADVPHFMDGTMGKGAAPEAAKAAQRWLAERGILPISVLFHHSMTPAEVMETVMNSNSDRPGLVFLLGGESRSGVNHTVVCCDGKIVCDPHPDEVGITGACDDGYYWVTFFGHLPSSLRGDAS